MKKYKVLFCDLDGTLIDTISGETFPKGIWDMKFKFDVLVAIKKFKPNYVFIITNQGYIKDDTVKYNHFWDKINYIDQAISEYLYPEFSIVSHEICTSNIENDPFKMPNTGMIVRLCNIFKFKNIDDDKRSMLMIGNNNISKKTAENFGIDYMDVNDFVNELNKH